MEAEKTGISEDWLSLWLGLFIFLLGLGPFVGLDLLGWEIKTNVWTGTSPRRSHQYPAISKVCRAQFPLIDLYLYDGRHGDRRHCPEGQSRQVYARIHPGLLDRLWLLAPGAFAYIASTKAAKGGIGWSLNLTGESGFIIALLAGLIVGNFFPNCPKN